MAGRRWRWPRAISTASRTSGWAHRHHRHQRQDHHVLPDRFGAARGRAHHRTDRHHRISPGGPGAAGGEHHAGIARPDAPVRGTGARRRHARHHGSFFARAGAGASVRVALPHRGLHQPHARPSGFSRHHGGLFRRQAAAVRRRRRPAAARSRCSIATTSTRGGSSCTRRRKCSGTAWARTPNLRARHISSGFQGLRFDVQFGKLRFAVESPLIGKINVYNILAACGAGLSYGIRAGDHRARHRQSAAPCRAASSASTKASRSWWWWTMRTPTTRCAT